MLWAWEKAREKKSVGQRKRFLGWKTKKSWRRNEYCKLYFYSRTKAVSRQVCLFGGTANN